MNCGAIHARKYEAILKIGGKFGILIIALECDLKKNHVPFKKIGAHIFILEIYNLGHKNVQRHILWL